MEIQQTLIEVLKFAISFFKAHNLRYYACGGTTLGAVRHKGFIPWDDDIDIYMPRADYERLISLRHEFNGTGFSFVSAQTNKGYYCPFAKITKDNTTIWEFKYYKYLLGAFIDIFPLDYYNISDEEITALQWKHTRLFINYQKSLKHYSFSDYMNMLKRADYYEFLKNIWFLIAYKPRSKQMFQRWMNAYPHTEEGTNDKCVCLTQWQGKIFQRAWFDDCIEVPFEDITITIPRQYDKYLTLLYGNYMQLPPEEKRQSDHKHYYVNINSH